MVASPILFSRSDKASPGFYGPDETALLLLDFHNMFIERTAGSKAADAVQVAAALRIWAKAQGITIVHALIDTKAEPYPTCKGADRLKGIIASMDGHSAEEAPSLREGLTEDERLFTRIPGYVSAFKSPGMHEFLQKKGIKSLILTGLSTSGCVMRTALPATDLEYIVTTVSDACADDGDGVHDFVINNVLNNRGYVTTSAEFRQGFESK